MSHVRWDYYPRIAASTHARVWLKMQADLGLAAKTVDAYGRAMEDYLAFSARCGVAAESATRAHIAAYVRDLTERPHPGGANRRALDSAVGLAHATMQLRLTAVRLYYDYLMAEGIRGDNPVGRGRYTPGKGFGGARDRALIPRYRKLPWIPSDDQWQAIVTSAQEEPLRNRLMLALAYDGALRREELCSLDLGDIDPAYRTVRVRAETTKNRQERMVRYSEETGDLLARYLWHRRGLTIAKGALLLSESHRNHAHPLSISMWSKVVQGIAARAGVPQFTTHTPRHLRLSDLARAGWDIHEIATFAGHCSLASTEQYIHLSGRELAAKLDRSMAGLHKGRLTMLQGGQE